MPTFRRNILPPSSELQPWLVYITAEHRQYHHLRKNLKPLVSNWPILIKKCLKQGCRPTAQRAIHIFSERILREFVPEFDYDVNLLKEQVCSDRANLTTDIALQKLFTFHFVKYLPYRESVQTNFNKSYFYVRPTYGHLALRVLPDKIDQIRFKLYIKWGSYLTGTKTSLVQQLLL
jgi:hypothetical protein